MSETVKKFFGRLPESIRNGALVFVILFLAFWASCWGTFAIFAGSFMRKTDWVAVSFWWAFLALWPIGFFGFFFKKLGFAEGFKWIAEFAGILVAYGVSWMVTVWAIENMSRRTYAVDGFVDSFETAYPSFALVAYWTLFIIEFALFCSAMHVAGKRYATRRKHYLENTSDSKPSE